MARAPNNSLAGGLIIIVIGGVSKARFLYEYTVVRGVSTSVRREVHLN